MKPARPTKKIKTLKKILRLIIVAICAAYLVGFFIQKREALSIAFKLDYRLILAIIGLQLLYYLLQSYRFQIVVEKCSDRKLPFFPWLKLFVLGRFLNTIFSQTGNVYRSVRLKTDYGISYTKYIGAFASIAWLDTCMNLGIAVVVIAIANPGFQIGKFTAWKILTVLSAVFIVVPILSEILLRKMNFKNNYLTWVRSKLSEVLTVSVRNLRDPIFLLKFFAIGMVIFVRTCILFHLYFRVFDIYVSLPALAVFYALFKLSFFIVLTPGNLGIQEVAWGFLSEQMGFGMAEGVLVSAFIRAIGTAVICTLGLVFGGADLIKHRKEYRDQT